MKLQIPSRKLALAFGAMAGLFLSAGATHAQILANWTLDNTVAASGVATNATGSNFTWTMNGGNTSSGVIGLTATDFRARWNFIATQTLNTGTYVQFSLTADPGYMLNLEGLSFVLGATTTATANRVANVSIRSDAETTPFSTNLSMTPGPVTVASVTANSNTVTQTFSVDLSGSGFQGLDTITFRIYPFGGTSTTFDATNVFTRWDNIQLSGAVAAIPEPSTYALLGGGLLIVALLRRSRKGSAAV